jgi:hypothetical protein
MEYLIRRKTTVPTQAYDIITMSQRGARVLILEKETRFRDRVRGEGTVPWGDAEARELGLLELLRAGWVGCDAPQNTSNKYIFLKCDSICFDGFQFQESYNFAQS